MSHFPNADASEFAAAPDPSNTGRSERYSRWFAPITLGLFSAMAALLLVIVELGEPPKQAGFKGIISNKISSTAARVDLDLFRRHLTWAPYPISDLVLSPHAYMWGLRAAILMLASSQLLALVFVLRESGGSPWRWLAGPILTTVILLAYPTVCTDAFSYGSFGWVAKQGRNPYLVSPASLPGDPFAKMSDWTKITTPYGPVWTGISRLFVTIAFDHPLPTILLFKLAAGSAALGLSALAYFGARRLGADVRHSTAAMVIIAWSPIVLIESAGMGHNDALMMLLAIGGLLLVSSPRSGIIRTGLVVITASVLVKPVALPLLGLAALVRLRRDHGGILGLLREWVLDLAAIAGLIVMAFIPYWGGGKLPRALWELERSLYFTRALRTNQLWVWLAPKTAFRIGGSSWARFVKTHAVTVSRDLVIIFIIAGLLIAIWPARRVQPHDEIGPATARLLRRETWAWFAITAGIGLFPINAHTWYTIWLMAPLAMVWASTARPRWQVWIGPALVVLLTSFIIYHTWPIKV